MSETTSSAQPDYLQRMQKELRRYDESRARSMQTEVGLSELLDCQAYIGHKLRGDWATDNPDTWRAIVGSFLHDRVQAVRGAAHPHLRFEVTLAYRGRPGHADEVDTENDEVTDYKFPGSGSAAIWRRDPAAFAPKRAQVHSYAAALVDEGVLTDQCTVRVLVAPVDLPFDEWWAHEEPFDRSVADQALDRYETVVRLHEAGAPLSKDKPYSWCERFCEHFTSCRGDDNPRELAEITDAELAAAVERYGELLELIGPLDKEKKKLAPMLKGLHGKARGWKASMTQPSGTKWVSDDSAIRQHFAAQGRELPQREVPSSTPSLRVTRAKTDK